MMEKKCDENQDAAMKKSSKLVQYQRNKQANAKEVVENVKEKKDETEKGKNKEVLTFAKAVAKSQGVKQNSSAAKTTSKANKSTPKPEEVREEKGAEIGIPKKGQDADKNGNKEEIKNEKKEGGRVDSKDTNTTGNKGENKAESENLGAEHLLQDQWTFWFMHRTPGQKIVDYEAAISKISNFSTVSNLKLG
ncbi:hypothetical protein AX774_g5013 [Zancudomyces culisetae]|uniref:Uncharacterized protein n=1 Tax=Zancudomyces culisetae TaxID=1213189 RepID=A0A1R1PKS2_ZANCU|nr:hypothetical protein AX774_g5013 [Zancudomyces culisetae]|eukprot:OMH81523.1 hypothetical protein AX774_g5013 [Zancudomyces culisetae]